MRIVRSASFSFLFLLACLFPAAAQDAPASSPAPATDSARPATAPATVQTTPSQIPPSQPAASFNDVIDKVVEREHLFLAQMRHMHPMVETYVQDLKNNKDGNAYPSNDQYFLGRLDMSDGPEDTSFVGQPGFGQRMVKRLTGLYSLHFLPLGFAQMVLIDTDFQKKYYKFTFVRREFLGEVRCLVIDVEPREDSGVGRFMG